MSPTRYLLPLSVALLLVAGASVAQQPQYVPPTTMDIAIGNYWFFDIRTPAAGYSVDQRQKLVNERLVEIFAAGQPKPVTVSCIRGKPTIFVNGIKLITVYERDAEAAGGGICTKQLAAAWAARVAEGLPRVWPGCRFPAQAAAAPVETAAAPDVPQVGPGK
ncbi:MAG: hypothetical protein FJX74_17945 [Armatimonadetes bacterium]|nr:hypothetical protein [Armatimonadota bacterium]